jgi:predicted DNA-binding transcriptional regulator AlpA
MSRKNRSAAKSPSRTRKQSSTPFPSDALRNFDSLPDSANVRQPVVEALCGFSAATVWRRVKDGGLPRPRKLSDRVTAWNVGELRTALSQGRGE